MKRLFFFLFIPISSYTQEVTIDAEKITYGNYTIQPGDTLHLGFGSGMNKKFVFVYYRPNLLTYDVSAGMQGLDHGFSNKFLILKAINKRKVLGKQYFDCIFTINGSNLKATMDLHNSFLSGEIKEVTKKVTIDKK